MSQPPKWHWNFSRPSAFQVMDQNISYHIVSNFIPISYNKTNKHKNTTWYWGHDQKVIKAWDNHSFNKGFNKHTETCKENTLQTDKNTHAPKWNQLYSDSKTDFNWFRKCFGFAMFYSFVQRIPKRRSTISDCMIRKHCLCFIDTVILGISYWVIVCLDMFSKIRWTNWWKLI